MSFSQYFTLFLLLATHICADPLFTGPSRDLWTCTAVDCTGCIAQPDKMYCSLNNQEGTCCTKSDGRTPCSFSQRNCSADVGFNTTNNFNYLVCGYNVSSCGQIPQYIDPSNPELDSRFTSNFILANNTAVTVTTPTNNFTTNTRCTYVIRKSVANQGLVFNVVSNLGATVNYFVGGTSFNSLTANAQKGTSTALTQQFQWSTFPVGSYLYIQLTSLSNQAQVTFSIYGIIATYIAPPTPVIPGAPPTVPPGTPSPTLAAEAAKPPPSNLPLIIGCVVGGLGFVGIVGFLVYYIMKQKRQMSQLAEDDEDEDGVSEFKKRKKAPKSKRRKIQESEENDANDDSIEEEEQYVSNKKKPIGKGRDAPVHPYDPPEGQQSYGVNAYQEPMQQNYNMGGVSPYQQPDNYNMGGINPYNPVALSSKLPPVQKLPNVKQLNQNFDFSSPFGQPMLPTPIQLAPLANNNRGLSQINPADAVTSFQVQDNDDESQFKKSVNNKSTKSKKKKVKKMKKQIVEEREADPDFDF